MFRKYDKIKMKADGPLGSAGATGGQMIKVQVIDDLKLNRDLLRILLAGQTDMVVAGNGPSGDEAVLLAEKIRPDLLLIGIRESMTDGIEIMRKIKEQGHGVKALFLTMPVEHGMIEKAVALGADGILNWDISGEELLLTIRSISKGFKVIHDEMWDQVRKISPKKVMKRGQNKVVLVEGVKIELTMRELSIIEGIVEGKTIAEISEEFHLTEGRMRNIITELIDKLMLRDRTGLVLFALKNGLLDNYRICDCSKE